jgi:hypothetical protein
MNDKQASVSARIAELSRLPTADVWVLWDRYFTSRPMNPNRAFLESRIAYKLQEEAFGGLSSATRQRLERSSCANGASGSIWLPSPQRACSSTKDGPSRA